MSSNDNSQQQMEPSNDILKYIMYRSHPVYKWTQHLYLICALFFVLSLCHPRWDREFDELGDILISPSLIFPSLILVCERCSHTRADCSWRGPLLSPIFKSERFLFVIIRSREDWFESHFGVVPIWCLSPYILSSGSFSPSVMIVKHASLDLSLSHTARFLFDLSRVACVNPRNSTHVCAEKARRDLSPRFVGEVCVQFSYIHLGCICGGIMARCEHKDAT